MHPVLIGIVVITIIVNLVFVFKTYKIYAYNTERDGWSETTASLKEINRQKIIETRRNDLSRREYFEMLLTFEYVVSGVPYQLQINEKAEDEAAAERYKLKETRQIFVNPNEPSQASKDRGYAGDVVGYLMAIAFLNGFAIGLFLLVKSFLETEI